MLQSISLWTIATRRAPYAESSAVRAIESLAWSATIRPVWKRPQPTCAANSLIVEYRRLAKVFAGEDRDALGSSGVLIRIAPYVELREVPDAA